MAADSLATSGHAGAMRAKRARSRPATPVPPEKPPDATGLTIDWIAQQSVGGGGLLPWWLVWGLVALRAAPFVAWRMARRLAGRGGRSG
jgi:hypothetical protein